MILFMLYYMREFQVYSHTLTEVAVLIFDNLDLSTFLIATKSPETIFNPIYYIIYY